MDKLKLALDWLVKSSANPEELALTVKAGLPLVALIATLLGFRFEESDVLALVHSIAIVITGLVTIFGLVRKIALTKKA